MRSWKAVTESGTVYTGNDYGVHVDSKRRGTFYIRIMKLKSIDRDVLSALPAEETWKYIHDAPSVEVPEVGKAIYISNFSEWNLSTHVVSLETFEEEEEDALDSDD